MVPFSWRKGGPYQVAQHPQSGPYQLAHDKQPISLLRVDCDLYSSTRKVLTVLRPLIRSGTWILFDELIGYRTWEDHEYKAFMEFVDETGFEFDYIAYGLTYTLVHLL